MGKLSTVRISLLPAWVLHVKEQDRCRSLRPWVQLGRDWQYNSEAPGMFFPFRPLLFFLPVSLPVRVYAVPEFYTQLAWKQRALTPALNAGGILVSSTHVHVLKAAQAFAFKLYPLVTKKSSEGNLLTRTDDRRFALMITGDWRLRVQTGDLILIKPL